MGPMKGVDRRRQTRQLAELAGHDIIAGDVVRHVPEFGARIAGWALPVENHIPIGESNMLADGATWRVKATGISLARACLRAVRQFAITSVGIVFPSDSAPRSS